MENKKSRILVADDEKEIREIIRLLLTGEGYDVVAAQDGEEALRLADETIDLYILDVNMPRMSGFSAAAQIREKFLAPIIFLTAYSGEGDKQMGFSAGADDYIVKPFSNTELILRIKSLLRRVQNYAPMQQERWLKEKQESQTGTPKKRELRYKDIVLDLDSQSARKGEDMIVLTYTEFKILELFLSHPKKIYSLENIYRSIWEEDAVGDSTIMVHIKNIRKKLNDSSRNPQYIKTAWGKGYYVD